MAKGYRRFGLVSVDDPRGVRRIESAARALQQKGMAVLPIQVSAAPATPQAGRDALSHLLLSPLPEVIICSTDTLALGLLAEAASRGIKVPDEVAVMGFGDLSTAAHANPALSTVRIDGAAIGRLAAEALLERLTDGGAHTGNPSSVDIGFSIIERHST